ncbi:MAG: LPS-assembly protein LptD, partial [Gammaproteobacteria bacterium]
AKLDIVNETSDIDAASFTLIDAHARGSAERIRIASRDMMRLHGASYTTCEVEDVAWMLDAASVELDREQSEGVAHDVWVTFYGVPLFYTPYLSFPIGDERKSGLLPPRVGVSGSTGFDLTVPYYFNLAPNYDATVSVRGMTDRGVQLGAEFRYLTELGRGELSAEYLPYDRDLEKDRSAISFMHASEFATNWRAGVDFSWVSDRDYFDDLGTNLGLSSRRYLRRRAELGYDAEGWFGLARVQDFQLLDETVAPEDQPYEALPQLLVGTALPERNAELNFAGLAEMTYFDRDDSVTGMRVDVNPSVSFPVRSAAGFLVPRADVRYTHYTLNDVAPGADASPSRFLPSFSLEGGLNFERELALFGNRFLHTVEPRLFYLYRPFDNQDDIPIFDTDEYTFTYEQLFRGDRFNGADRLGDANQLSLGLDTRLLSAGNGQELASLRVGQIRYFRDRKVRLPGRARDADRDSDLIAQAQVMVDQAWRVRGALQWNVSDERTNRSMLGVQFRPDDRRVVNATYRFLREVPQSADGSVEQIDLSFAWPFGRNWRGVGRYNYALSDNTTLEAFAGIEYESCCWSLRLVGRRYLSDRGRDHSTGIFAQLELKGLTGIGRSTTDFLERNIAGYENEF